MGFERGFLSKPRVQALLARFAEEDARQAKADQESAYQRAIRTWYQRTERQQAGSAK